MLRWGWLAAAGAALLLGCGDQPTGRGGAAAPAGARKIKAGMVTDVGGIGDLSFNHMAWKGLERAQSEVGAEIVKIESKQQADYAPNLERLAQRGCDVVFAIGFALEDALKEVAPRYPQTRFAIIDAKGPDLPNVAGLSFREEEGSYLVGALAGGMSKAGTLGFVGGMEIPLIKRFEAGYRAGVRTTNPDAKVIAKYTNNWIEVRTGRELALTLYNQGADVIYHASGRCGLGVIEAAKSKGPGFWAIGVDADQDHLGTANPEAPKPPSRVLTSMMKRVDNAVFTVCKEASEGKFQPGARVLGVKEEGVGLTPLQYTRSEIPADLLKEVERLKELVSEGRLKPPASLDELEGWQPPAAASARSGPASTPSRG